MKFKIAILTFAFLSIISVTVKSQKADSRFYIRVYGGYGILTPGSDKFVNSQFYTDPSIGTNGTPYNHYNQTDGLGKGLHYGGGIGYIIDEFLNVGVDADYLSGAKLSAPVTDSYSYPTYGDYYSNSSLNVTSSVFSIIPNITFKALSKPTYYIYTRVGLIITIKTKLQVSEIDSANYSSSSTYSNSNSIKDYTFKTNLGLQASLGVQFRLTGNLRGFAELAAYFLPTKPTSMTSTVNSNYTSSSSAPSYSRNIDIYNYSTSGVSTTGIPDQSGSGNSPEDPVIYKTTYSAPTPTIKYNSLGINIGVALRL